MDISNNNSPEFQQAKDVARKLEKVIERTSVHSCGWLVYPSSLGEIIPVRNLDSTRTLISMYDARSAEEVGVLRLNILSLRALKIVKDAFMTIRHYGVNVEPDSIPLNDGPTIKLFSDGDSTGVFLFESAGIRKWLRILHPSSFNDISSTRWPFTWTKSPEDACKPKESINANPQRSLKPQTGPPSGGPAVFQNRQCPYSLLAPSEITTSYTLGSWPNLAANWALALSMKSS